jgi:hypothetical protein
MDSKSRLLKEFYRGLPKDRAKVETFEHGFEYLDRMLAGGGTLEYGEMSFAGLLHKYKLSQVPEERMDDLIAAHIAKRCNLCLYFGPVENSLFCFNLDNNHKTNNTVIIPEMARVVELLRDILTEAGCEPLIIASGRGYHLWCRLAAAVDNERLYQFMVRCMAKALLGLHKQGCDHNKIKANFYPDPRARNVVSLRLFGSMHVKNKVFSRVLTRERLLEEEESWVAFEEYLRERTIGVEGFEKAARQSDSGQLRCGTELEVTSIEIS